MDIIASINPWDARINEIICRLIRVGVKVFRINMKSSLLDHDYTDFEAKINSIFSMYQDAQLILDVAYPKDTLRSFIRTPNGHLTVNADDVLQICFGCDLKEKVICFDFPPVELNIGEDIVYGDGYNALRVIKKTSDRSYLVKAMYSGEIWTNKAFHFTREIICPGSLEKQTIDLIKSIHSRIPVMVALSFVECAQEIQDFKKAFNDKIPVIAKIETQKGLDALNNILKQTNIAMLGRGDLLFHSKIYDFVKNQRLFVDCCSKNSAYPIIATGILNSMIHRRIPDRSDITDLVYLVDIGCKAVVLSNYLVSGDHFESCYSLVKEASTHAKK